MNQRTALKENFRTVCAKTGTILPSPICDQYGREIKSCEDLVLADVKFLSQAIRDSLIEVRLPVSGLIAYIDFGRHFGLSFAKHDQKEFL